MHYFPKCVFGTKFYMFRTVPLSIIRIFSLYTKQLYVSYRFVDSLRAGSGKPVGKSPLERPRRGWEDNIKMDLQEVGFGDMDWIELAQDRDRWHELVNAVIKFGFREMRGIS